jgi:hypothetical protein
LPIQISSFYAGNGEFDVSPDAQHFLFVKAREQNALPAEVRVALNWSEGWKSRIHTGNQP